MISHATRRSVVLPLRTRANQNAARALRTPAGPTPSLFPGRPGFLSRAYAFAERHPIETAMIAPAPFVALVMIVLHQTGALFWWLEHVVLPAAGR
jgi:hypothetical protein